MTQKAAAAATAAAEVDSPRPSASIHVPASQTHAVHRGKVKYDKKAESEFFVDNSALAGFTGERIL
ncbi:MAG: hypothetical protein C4292_00090, partial [Nitrososphaera sp.]